MKMGPKSAKPSFRQPGNAGDLNQHKNLAKGTQKAVGVVKKPGSRSSGGGVKIRSM